MIHLIIIDLRIAQASTLQEYDIALAYLIQRSVGIWVSTRRKRRLNGEVGGGSFGWCPYDCKLFKRKLKKS